MEDKDIITGELIGKHITIKGTTTHGDIINETQHTLTIHTSQGERRIQKKGHVFVFPNGACIDGKDLAYKPHERVKRHHGNKNNLH